MGNKTLDRVRSISVSLGIRLGLMLRADGLVLRGSYSRGMLPQLELEGVIQLRLD